jgi:hypothetical protein
LQIQDPQAPNVLFQSSSIFSKVLFERAERRLLKIKITISYVEAQENYYSGGFMQRISPPAFFEARVAEYICWDVETLAATIEGG